MLLIWKTSSLHTHLDMCDSEHTHSRSYSQQQVPLCPAISQSSQQRCEGGAYRNSAAWNALIGCSRQRVAVVLAQRQSCTANQSIDHRAVPGPKLQPPTILNDGEQPMRICCLEETLHMTNQRDSFSIWGCTNQLLLQLRQELCDWRGRWEGLIWRGGKMKVLK